MPIQDDFQISATGDIRRQTGASSTIYSVLALHQWLQDLADDAASTGNDLVDILAPNPSRLDGPRDAAVASRLNLLASGSINFNLDDAAARFINFGSIKQDQVNNAGVVSYNTLYSGLKTIGGIVADSPIYVVQNNSKLTFTPPLPNGHIQILIKARSGGSLIANGDVTSFSRKWGQTYSHFDVNLSAGGESSAALSTALDSTIGSLPESDPGGGAAWGGKRAADITITFGDTTQDLGNGNGAKLYKGTITLSNGCTLQEAYQYLQWITRENSTTTLNSIPGWRYRSLVENQTGTITTSLTSTTVNGTGTSFTSSLIGTELYTLTGNLIGKVASVTNATQLQLEQNALFALSTQSFKIKLNYTEIVSAPFGTFAGGTFFVAQGWYLTGVLGAESTRYVLTAHDGTLQSPPSLATIEVGNLRSGDRVLATRANGSGQILKDEYTPVNNQAIGTTAFVVVESIKSDTPTSGVIRIKNKRYEYSSYNSATKTFNLTSGLLDLIVTADDVFVPFIDAQAVGGTDVSPSTLNKSFTFASSFSARVDVRNGSGAAPIVPFATTVTVQTTGASVNASRNSDV